jgi:hypothetical protein
MPAYEGINYTAGGGNLPGRWMRSFHDKKTFFFFILKLYLIDECYDPDVFAGSS